MMEKNVLLRGRHKAFSRSYKLSSSISFPVLFTQAERKIQKYKAEAIKLRGEEAVRDLEHKVRPQTEKLNVQIECDTVTYTSLPMPTEQGYGHESLLSTELLSNPNFPPPAGRCGKAERVQRAAGADGETVRG